jgi:hypothetical protein
MSLELQNYSILSVLGRCGCLLVLLALRLSMFSLCRGSFAEVYEAIHLPTQTKVAIKAVLKERLGPTSITNLQREIEIMRQLRHQNGVKHNATC